MADLRIVDAPEIPTEDITGEEKLPTGGSGNYSISLDSLADYTKTKKDLADNTSVDGKVYGVRQELDTHIEDLLNPHQVTKGQIGLGNVDNTADADKPVSNSTQAAIISAVAPKADKTYVDTALSSKAEKTYVDNQLTFKADKADVYTKSETYTKQESSDLVSSSISTALTPVNSSLGLAKRGIANRYDSSLTYNSGERVVLTNGDIVKSTIDGNTNDPNVDMTGWVFDWADAFVPSINDLPVNAHDGMTVYVKSYHAGLGLGGGIRTYDSQRQQEDDGFLCIRGWVLQVHGSVTPEQAGCYGDGTEDDAIGLQAVFSSGYKVACRTGANYRTSKPIEMFDRQKIEGNRATITKFSASTTGIVGKLDPSGSSFNYDVDCAVVLAPSNTYYTFIDINDLIVTKEKVSGNDVGYVFYSPFMATSTLRNITVYGGEYGFWGADVWMVSWERCAAYSKCGFRIGAGTSNTFNACWSKETKQGYSSFDFNNLIYSTLINCCAEAVGEDGLPAEAAYSFNSCDLTMVSCAIEGIHAYNLVQIHASRVSIDSPMFAINIHNKYRHATRSGLIDIRTDPCVVNLRGGRVATMDSGNSAAPINVVDSTLNCSGVLWWGLSTPNSSSGNKLQHNQSCNIDMTTYYGESYEYSSVADVRKTVNIPVLLNGNIIPRGAGNTPLSAFRKNVNVYQQNTFAYGSIANEYPVNSFAGVVLSLGGASDVGECVQVAASTYSPDLHYRTASFGSGFASWRKLYHSSNTTVDSNGFIKNASPIVQVFADKIELNDEAQQQNIEFEKFGVGDYLIKGSSGFAQEGWYIETPKDANGNLLVAVVYEQLANGDISVKTYDYMLNNKGRIVADTETPVDINETRWIDLRLQELSQPESEVTDDLEK